MTLLAFTCAEDRALRLVRRPKPRVRPDSVVVRVLRAAICGTDLRTYRHGSERIRPPRVIGHEACGVIEEVGPAVAGLAPGRRVVVVPAVGCGQCRWCRAGRTNMCDGLRTIGFDFDGTFAEYLDVPSPALGNILAVDESTSTEQAVLAEPAACCLNGQEDLQIGPGDTVFIFGSGFIGCVHAELALMKGARRVILSDVSSARLEAARGHLPSVETVDTTSVDAETFVRERTDGLGADVIITACPAGDAHVAAMKLAATRARISLFGGIPGEGRGFLDSNAIHYKELSVHGSHASTVAQNRQVMQWLSAGRLDLAKYVSATFPLAQIVEAFEALRSEAVLKVLIRP